MAPTSCRAKRHSQDITASAGLDFRYRDPEPNFQASRVKGVVAKLVQVKDSAAATALEVAAGGKLYQVVVDSEATGKALLSKGQLRCRVTIIPLNRVGLWAWHAEDARAAALSLPWLTGKLQSLLWSRSKGRLRPPPF